MALDWERLSDCSRVGFFSEEKHTRSFLQQGTNNLQEGRVEARKNVSLLSLDEIEKQAR
jgi:hypothetical protein